MVESVNPFTIFETDSNAELGSVMSSMINQERPEILRHTIHDDILEQEDDFDFEDDLVPVVDHQRSRKSTELELDDNDESYAFDQDQNR